MDQVFGSSLVNLSEATGLVKAKNDSKVSTGSAAPTSSTGRSASSTRSSTTSRTPSPCSSAPTTARTSYWDGKVLKVGTKAWQEVYAQRVGEAMDILTKGGRRVYWVGNPIMRDPGYRERIAMMDHIYEAEAKKHPGVTFVSTWKLLSDEKGSYTEYLEDEDGDSC